MIVTITPNPAVDISYQLDQFTYDSVHRVKHVSKTAGGKGLNVARVLNQLQKSVGASGFVGGVLGDFIRSEIHKLGIKDLFVPISGDTRNCIAIIHDNGQQTEILENGPKISQREGETFIDHFRKVIQEASIVTISGSLPKGLDKNFYIKLLSVAEDLSKRVILDTNGQVMRKMFLHEERPFMITPNEREFADLIGKNVCDENGLIDALRSDDFAGIPWVIVTQGAEGAIVKHEKNIYRVTIPKVKVINPVGSGDSVVAGFAAGLMKQLPVKKLIAYGMTMGVLNAMEEKTGHINPDHLESILQRVVVEELDEASS